jgi:hypothetical protein
MLSRGVFLLWPPPISPVCQTSRQRQRQRDEGCGEEIRGPLLCHTICFVHLQLLPSWGIRHFLAIVSLYKLRTGGPVRAHPRPCEFTMDPWIGTPHSLCNHLHLRLALSHTLTKHSTSTPLPEPERHSFTPKGSYYGVFGSWLDYPSVSWGRPEFEPGFLPVWWVGLPGWFLSLSGFLCAPELTSLAHQARCFFSSDQHGLVVPGRGSSPCRLGMLSWPQGGENTTF